MRSWLLEILCCPHCRQELSLEIFSSQGLDIENGVLKSTCGRSFPVIDFIPRFQPEVWSDDVLLNRSKHEELNNRNAFEFEWLNYNVTMGNESSIFLNETQIPANEWAGKLALDAGCGMGRYTAEALKLEAKVIGLDLGLNIDRAYQQLKVFPGFQAIQADLMQLPFKPDSFDIVYSLGVLHHTPQASQAFRNLARLVKKGGILSVWVYGRAGKYRDFITNPFRPDRQNYAGLLISPPISYGYWGAVKMREWLSAGIRLVTTRLPHQILLWLCYVLAAVGGIPLLKYGTFSVLPDWPARVWENFDWLSPYFQSHHTKEEVRNWFEKAAFTDLSVLPHGLIPKPGYKGKKAKSH